MRRFITLSLLAAVAVPALAPAQEPPPQPRERDRVYTFQFGPQDHAISLMRRGRLGVTVDMRADAARDSVGALIAGVAPGGAAERAGIRTGDIVTRLNGSRLAGPAPSGEDIDAAESHPAHRLIQLASRLDPGDTVRLEVRRDGRLQTFTFQAEESDMDMLVRRMGPGMLPELLGPALRRGFDIAREAPGRFMVSIGGALNDIELVKVNPGLGEYFGTTEGLLVTNVGSDSALGLRSGDVVLSIGGRRPTSVQHALRILSTYDPGEAVQLEVMRQRRRVTVSGHMPEGRQGGVRIRRNSYEIPDIRFLPRDGAPWIEFEHPVPSRQRVIIKA